MARKGPLQRRQPGVDLRNVAQHRRHALAPAAGLAGQPAQGQCLFVQGRDLDVARGPHADRGIDLLDMAEIPVEPHHPRNVFGMVAAGKEPFMDALQVRLVAVELQRARWSPSGIEIDSRYASKSAGSRSSP